MVLRQSRFPCSPTDEAPELFRHFQTVLLCWVSFGWDLLMELQLTETDLDVVCFSVKKTHIIKFPKHLVSTLSK